MKLLNCVEFGNPILRLRAKKVTLNFLKSKTGKTFMKDMLYTMRKSKGIGLAAPQIGKSLQIIVMEIRPTPERPKQKQKGPVFAINPKIINYSKKIITDWEACLSLGRIYALVPRPKTVTVEYYNQDSKKITEKASGLWARIFQHEIDHLNGLSFMDRVKDFKSIMTSSEFIKRVAKKK
ncbi:MAG: peptide deformylase [Candidatus Paceibacterota bacterium]|jgi:peptide deformylase